VSSRPTLDEIRRAAAGLRGVAVRTPLIPWRDDPSILLKPEILQPVTSFKLRGVFHAVASLEPERRAAGVSTVSAGNTAQALAWSARHFGVSARSLMPEGAPQSKIDAVRRLGGEPVLVPGDELFAYLGERRWEAEPYAFIHPWTERNLQVGHASLGLEVVEDGGGVRSVYVPVGGGGLLGGVGAALKQLDPSIRIVAVEPEGCPALHESLAHGEPRCVPCETICDGVAVPFITAEMFPLLADLADEVRLVPEAAVRATIRDLALAHRMIVEPSGALALAAAREEPESVRGRSVCPLTGGSIAADLLQELLGTFP
jgi:threonine dehydratase